MHISSHTKQYNAKQIETITYYNISWEKNHCPKLK